MRFDEVHLKPEIQKSLAEMGFTDLTPVQEQTFSCVIGKRDLIAMAQTGSGKTAACAIPLVQRVDPANKAVQALIIVPTRELALQYVAEIAAIAKYTNVRPFAVYGGFPMDIQISKLADGVQILVATPGRLIDLLYNTPLSLSEVATFVLDEADEMLKMGFLTDVELLFSCLIHEHQTMLFSATIPKEIRNLVKSHLKDPLTIELNVEHEAPESLEHYFMQVRPGHRLEKLLEYFEAESPEQAILFCNSRTGAEKLYQKLKEKLDSVEIIHGGLEQSRRTSLFRRFRDLKIRFMVATDIAGRGLDFSHATHVINFDFPKSLDAYTHRTGRTARMGRLGKAMTFIMPSEMGTLCQLLRQKRIEPRWLGPAPDMQKSSHHHDERSHSQYRGGKPRSGRGRDQRHHHKDKGQSSAS
jgi:ATP-dependent RNA helicase DeaD